MYFSSHALPLLGLVSSWLTPFWLFALGITLGTLVVGMTGLALFATQPQSNRRFWMLEIYSFCSGGFVAPLLILAGLMSVGTLLSLLLSLVGYSFCNEWGFLRSLARLPVVHDREWTFKIEPAANVNSVEGPTPQPLNVDFRAAELAGLTLNCDQPVVLRIPDENAARKGSAITLKKKTAWEFTRGGKVENPFFGGVTNLEAIYEGKEAAQLTFSTRQDVEFPQVRFALHVAVGFVAILLVQVIARLLFPKIYAVAVATCQEGLGQPLFYLVLAIGLFCLFGLIVIPMYTFGEDIKMYKDAGLTLILILSLILTFWNASDSIAEEIEGKTAVTVLSKPIGRRTFVLGKYFGILGPAAVTFLILGVALLLTTSYKVVYDQRENAKSAVFWVDCHREMISVVPGLLLDFMEIMVLASISVMLSTRLPMLPNLLISFSVYVLGHIVPLIVSSSVGKLPLVAFVGKLVATILPVLDHFSIEAALIGGAEVPAAYLWMTLGYTVTFSAMALLLGLFLFENRDVA